MIKEINNKKYSLKSFDEYEFRAKFVFQLRNDIHQQNFDVYTTSPSKKEVEKIFIDRINEKYGEENLYKDFTKLENWSSKRQDDINEELIKEWLNE